MKIAEARDDIYKTSKIFYELFILKVITVSVSILIYLTISFNATSYRTARIILGMFVFGMACKKPVNDKLVPVVCIAAPLISLVLQKNSEAWFNGYQIGFELLLINAALTVIGLAFLIKKNK